MPLHLDILDVGQGDGMVLWLPNGKIMMIDFGSTKNKGMATDATFKYFRNNTAFKDNGQWLEWLVLTHGDRDHYNMVWEFLTHFGVNVRKVLHGGSADEYSDLITKLETRRNTDDSLPIIVTGVDRPFFDLDTFDNLGCSITVCALGVAATSCKTEGYLKNTKSAVLRIVYQGIAIMLTGDATVDTEGHIIGYIRQKKGDPRKVIGSNVLKIGHHGSHRTSNHAVWFQSVNPNYAFISSDRSGSLDPDMKVTGFRLPQALTVDLLVKYASELMTDCVPHTYVVSHQKSDYDTYNNSPDIKGEFVALRQNVPSDQWLQDESRLGIFSTLWKMGLSSDPEDEGAADLGVQYRVTITDDPPDIEVLATDSWESFTPVRKKKT
jgi:beta-lactamase superfamily II metal-dependent hydrolase